MVVRPYLFLNGTAEAALAHYTAIGLGAVVELGRYGDAPPMPGTPEGWADKVLHAEFTGPGVALMVSDTAHAAPMAGCALTIGLADRAEADRLYAALADGGQPTMPLADTFWGAYFGTLTDRFGVQWMLNCEPPRG